MDRQKIPIVMFEEAPAVVPIRQALSEQVLLTHVVGSVDLGQPHHRKWVQAEGEVSRRLAPDPKVDEKGSCA